MSTNVPPSASPASDAQPRRRFHPSTLWDTATKRVLWGIVLVIVVGVVLYCVGLTNGRGDLAAVRARYNEQVDAAQADAVSARSERDAAQVQLQVARARAMLYSASIALERRNFGTAQRLADDAADALRPAAGKAPGIDVGAVVDDLGKLNITVNPDVATQRATLIGLAERLGGPGA